MRIISGLLLTIFVMGCADSKQNEKVGGILPDTIYDGNIIWRERLEAKRPMIQLDNGTGEVPKFSVGDTSILRIRIPRLTKYEVRLTQIIGAAIIKVDSANNKFLVTASDSVFSFVVNQYYPKGRVVRCFRNWNEKKGTYDEQITEIHGLRKIGRLSLKAQ
jgi:hypothetical protein